VGVERKHPEIWKTPREEFCKALGILLGKAGHRDVLKVQAIFPGKVGSLASYLLENLHGVMRNDLDVAHVIGRAIQVVTHCNDEASEAVKLDRSWQLAVHFREKLEPGRS